MRQSIRTITVDSGKNVFVHIKRRRLTRDGSDERELAELVSKRIEIMKKRRALGSGDHEKLFQLDKELQKIEKRINALNRLFE